MLALETKQLDAVAKNVTDILKLSSNIGDIGMAPDFSNNSLRNPLQNDFPLVNWLLSTPFSATMRNASRRGLGQIHKNSDGDWVVMFPFTVGTLPPTDTTGACCWVPLDIAKCGGTAPLRLLCLKDCDSIMNNLINQNRYPGSNDLIGYLQREGESVKEARKRMARLSMAFFTAYNMILGTTTAGTDILKPFHGLLEVMESPDVTPMYGANPLAVFDSLWCRLQILGAGNYAIAVHPLTYMGIASTVQPGRFNELPAGWTKSGDEIRFNGIGFIQDTRVPIDLTAGTGEAWVLDGNVLAAFMGTDLMPADSFTRHGSTSTDNPDEGCASECDFYYNYGSVFTSNPNRLTLITDIPLSSNCIGTALQGLDDLVQPTTLVPMV